MNWTQIEPFGQITQRYLAPFEPHIVRVSIQATLPFSAMITSENGMATWLAGGDDVEGYGTAMKVKRFVREFEPLPGLPWYLVLINDLPVPVFPVIEVRW